MKLSRVTHSKCYNFNETTILFLFQDRNMDMRSLEHCLNDITNTAGVQSDLKGELSLSSCLHLIIISNRGCLEIQIVREEVTRKRLTKQVEAIRNYKLSMSVLTTDEASKHDLFCIVLLRRTRVNGTR